MKNKDERMKIMGEVLNGIKVSSGAAGWSLMGTSGEQTLSATEKTGKGEKAANCQEQP